MSDLNVRQERIEVLVNELQDKVESFEEILKEKIEHNDMILSMNELIKDEELVTTSDLENIQKKMEAYIQASQVRLMKWIIATGLSTIAMISAIIGMFIN